MRAFIHTPYCWYAKVVVVAEAAAAVAIICLSQQQQFATAKTTVEPLSLSCSFHFTVVCF